jgi:predicted negative regulator of RcsB-dependent stress response
MDKGKEDMEEIPAIQRYFDNMWLLLILSTLILAISYVGWGVWEALNVPAK